MWDAWMNSWTEKPLAMMDGWTAMQDALQTVADSNASTMFMPAITPVMAPAMIAAVTVNTAAATCAGLWMGLAQAPIAAMGAMTGEAGNASAAKSAPGKQTRTKVTVQVAATPKVESAPKAAAAKASAPKTPVAAKATKVDDRPDGLDAPRSGKADDLKKISGVGPKLETVLNDLGIYHFDQIAAWKAAEIRWVDEYLRFKGRIKRDGWIAQAKALAKEAA